MARAIPGPRAIVGNASGREWRSAVADRVATVVFRGGPGVPTAAGESFGPMRRFRSTTTTGAVKTSELTIRRLLLFDSEL
jgi:hypothetical protein